MDDLETKYNALHGFQSKRATDKPLLQRSMSAEVRREPVESISEFQEQHKTCEFPLECKDFQKLAIVEEDFVLPSSKHH